MRVIIGDKELDPESNQVFNSTDVPIVIYLGEFHKKNLLQKLKKYPNMRYYIAMPEETKKLGPLVDQWIDKLE